VKQYKKWTGKQRSQSYAWTMKAIKDGIITGKQTKVCERCSQDKGIIMLHNEDYDVTLTILGNHYEQGYPVTDEHKDAMNEVLWEMCWRCHMVLHSIHRAPEACRKYWVEINSGKQYPPVFKHDFNILRVDHGIK